MADCDVVVIGSGAGGLAAALALARAGKRVTVFEQHYLPGGWCHSFSLEGYHFSPGVHYIGDLGPGGRMRQVYEGLGVGGDLVFHALNPDGFDHLTIGGERFDVPAGKDRLAERLRARFPREAKGIGRWLDIVERIGHELDTGFDVAGPADLLKLPARIPTVLRYGLLPSGRVVGGLVEDPLLRAILQIQGGDHGMPPSRAPTALHAAVVSHYFNGAWYPRGGGRAIPKAFIKQLKAHGGEIQVRTPVARILTEGRRAVGVVLGDGTEVRADAVISNADPHTTFTRLLDPEVLPALRRLQLKATRYSISSLALFLALDQDPRAFGMDSGNLWWSETADLEAFYRYAATDDPLRLGPPPGFFLTATTLKDPTLRHDGRHTLETFAFVSHEAFARFAGRPVDDRGADYDAYKDALADALLARVDRALPGLADRVVFRSVGTPLTNVHYVATTAGSLYGTEKSALQVGPLAWPVRSPVAGLWMCGASTLGHGVAGATFSGLAAAASVLRTRVRDLLSTRGPAPTLYDAEALGRAARAPDVAPKHRAPAAAVAAGP